MSHQRLGAVSRRRVLRALQASGIETRPQGGEHVVVFLDHHQRLGGRKGVGPVRLGRLLKDLAASGTPTEELTSRLYGKTAARVRSAGTTAPTIADDRGRVERGRRGTES